MRESVHLRQPSIVTGQRTLPVTMRASLHRRSTFMILAQVSRANIPSDEAEPTVDAWCIHCRLHDAGAAHHKIFSKHMELSLFDSVGQEKCHPGIQRFECCVTFGP